VTAVNMSGSRLLRWLLAANVVLFMYYMSPLSTLADVLRHRDSSSLTLPMSVMNVVNGLLWVVYGFVRGDAFIWVPNGFGVCLGVLQVALCCIFPRRLAHEAVAGCEPAVQTASQLQALSAVMLGCMLIPSSRQVSTRCERGHCRLPRCLQIAIAGCPAQAHRGAACRRIELIPHNRRVHPQCPRGAPRGWRPGPATQFTAHNPLTWRFHYTSSCHGACQNTGPLRRCGRACRRVSRGARAHTARRLSARRPRHARPPPVPLRSHLRGTPAA
jgi:uncharacterized protein with PQ loop repeat